MSLNVDTTSRDTRLMRLLPPWWVGLIIAVLALIDPVMHRVNHHFPPAGTVATTSHTLDTFVYLNAMAHARPPYVSPYSLCDNPLSTGNLSLFPLTYQHLYGAVGSLGRLFRLTPSMALGLANALGVVAYLWAVWYFLRVAVPNLAGRSFLLFAAGGGLGGWAYLVAVSSGLDTHENFAALFQRYFYYELCEGPRAQPYLMITRLYYTLPMAFGFAALSTLMGHLNRPTYLSLYRAGLFLALAGLVNLRLAPLFLGVALLCLLNATQLPVRKRGGQVFILCLGTGIGAIVSLWLLQKNPDVIARSTTTMRSGLWLSPYLSAACWCVLLLPPMLYRTLRGGPALLQAVGNIALCHGAAFIILYGLYQAYYGNFWQTSEYTAAIRISDPALALGLPLGLALSWWQRRRPLRTTADVPPWIACWWCCYFAVAVSAFGQGYSLRFAPDRIAVLLGLPLAIIAAGALSSLGKRYPRLSIAYTTLIVVSGILSCAITWTVTYGPLGYSTLQRHYDWTRSAFMSAVDGRLLAQITGGTVLAPATGAPLMGDLAVVNGHNSVYGIGSYDSTRAPGRDVRAEVNTFFAPDTPELQRKSQLQAWCVDFIYCPDTDPVDDLTRAQLADYPWLQIVAEEGAGLLLHFDIERAPGDSSMPQE